MGKAKRIKQQKAIEAKDKIVSREADKARAAELMTELRAIAERNADGGTSLNELAPNEHVEDLNILPLPDSQTKHDYGLEWKWFVRHPDTGVVEYLVTARLYLKDRIAGSTDYEVTEEHVGEPCTAMLFAQVFAKPLGKALISASSYRNIWKQHAGVFMERELIGEPEVEVAQVDPKLKTVESKYSEEELEEFRAWRDRQKQANEEYAPNEMAQADVDNHVDSEDDLIVDKRKFKRPEPQVITPDGIESEEAGMGE